MTTGSFRGRPGHVPLKVLCKKCKKTPALQGKDLCGSCTGLSPEVRNSPSPKNPRQRR